VRVEFPFGFPFFRNRVDRISALPIPTLHATNTLRSCGLRVAKENRIDVFHDIGADIQETTLVFDWDERTLCDALSCVVSTWLSNIRFPRGEFGYSLAEQPVVADKADSGRLALADGGFAPCTIGHFIGLFNYRNGRVNVLQILHVK
jgi:hypothetical protein